MTRRKCSQCDAILSTYNQGLVCAPCETKTITHAEYTAACDPAQQATRLRGDDVCKRGHDLLTHGVMKNTGGGRISRKCRACERERATNYRQRKATA